MPAPRRFPRESRLSPEERAQADHGLDADEPENQAIGKGDALCFRRKGSAKVDARAVASDAAQHERQAARVEALVAQDLVVLSLLYLDHHVAPGLGGRDPRKRETLQPQLFRDGLGADEVDGFQLRAGGARI
jgi:hypothetical protein